MSSFVLAKPLKESHSRVAAMMAMGQAQDESLRRVGDYAGLNFSALLGPAGTKPGIFLPIHHTHAELANSGQRSSLLIKLGMSEDDAEGPSFGRVKVAGLLKGHPNPLNPYRTAATDKNLVRRSRDWGLDYDN
jgi:hypothetical protein